MVSCNHRRSYCTRQKRLETTHPSECMRRIDAGTATGRLFNAARMGRAVGAEKEFGISAGRSVEQRLAVLLPLQNRQAIMMRANAARKQRVTVKQKVMRRDGGADARRG